MKAYLAEDFLNIDIEGHVIPPKFVRTNLGFWELLHWRELITEGNKVTTGVYRQLIIPYLEISPNGAH